jgi:hypothetical protein
MLYDALWRVRDDAILLLLLELLANIDYDMPYTSKCLYNDEEQSQSAAVIRFDR